VFTFRLREALCTEKIYGNLNTQTNE